MKKFAITAFALVSLSGCEAATEMATDAIGAEVRTRYIEQCEGVAEGANIGAENVTAACECSADKFAEDMKSGELQIDQARIEEVLKTCVQEQIGTADATPAENTNG